jgi:hypothetical protein
MMLLVSLVLAFIPLLGIAWILLYGSITTVDGLFMSLILLTMSGVFALNAFLELRKGKVPASSAGGSRSRGSGISSSSGDGSVQRGTVQSVQFFESPIGQPNKSIVVLANGSKTARTLVFDGDVRNALPIGRNVELTLRKEPGQNVLLNVSYS